MKYLQLIRYKNLLMIALVQFVFRFGFLKFQNVYLSLADWQYLLMILATVLIAAGGYIINDIYDQDADAINKPSKVLIGTKINEDLAYNIYIGFNIVALIIGYYLSNVIQKTSFFGLFIIAAMLLYVYATGWKKILIIGNLIISFVVSLTILMIGFFDLLPATYEGNQQIMMTLQYLLLDYAIFAFIITFIREIVKDIEDIDGDYNVGVNSLPIVLGKERATKVVLGLTFIFLVMITWYTNQYLVNINLFLAAGYIALSIIAPLVLVIIKLWKAGSKNDYTQISTLLKIIMFLGILSIAVITFNIRQNVIG